MKTAKILIETALPITIGTSILIGYFFTTSNLAENQGLESCEKYQIDNLIYLIYAFIIIFLSSLYQLTIGQQILKRNENSFLLNIFNCVVFSTVFTGILISINLFQKEKKIEWEFFFIIYITILFLGLFFLTLTKLCRKIFRKKLYK